MSGGAKARLFVAVDVPAAVRERLAGWTRDAAAALRLEGERSGRSLRLLDPDSLHMTLCFLGSRPVDEIAAIGASLRDCAAYVGELSVGAPLWLPRRRPRALAIAIHDDDGELARLHGAVVASISRASGWEPQPGRFRAHITVARPRGRERRGASAIAQGPQLLPTPPIRFTAESMTLYRSWLAPGGATYEPLAACRLVPAGI